VLTRHEVAAIWGGKKIGLMTHNPETRMRSILLGEGEETLAIEWNVADDVPRWLYCGKSGLQKAMSQLLVNAIKFTPTGRITLQVTREAAQPAPGRQLNDMVVFSIKDTGIGVEEQYHQYLARPFFQVDPSTTRSREGSGLGLMLAHRWATKMGGGLRLESSCTVADDPRHGSEFSLRLPIAKNLPIPVSSDADSDDEWTVSPSGHDTPPATGISPNPKRRKSILAAASNAYDSHLAKLYPLKIMVAEDNEMLRKLMAQLLEKLGYKSSQVVLCNNGQEAVDYFRTRNPKEYDIDLILMDCWMPIMDGLDATKQILDLFPANSNRHPGIKPDIVAITADNLPDNLAKTEDSGMRGYMVKPIKLNDLQRVVEECAEGNWVMKKLAT
jgi:CheY-like chemotaxis protein